ncbi:MAG: hydroxyacid dehydrogenase [Anaerolineales bacterium]
MAKPVVLLYEPIHEKAMHLLSEQADVRISQSLDIEHLINEVGDVDGIIIRANGQVSREVMQAAPNLKVVARHGTGVEAIDHEAAAELGIVVVNTPEANVESVAEQCLAFMIVLVKRLLESDAAIRAGDWDARYRLIGTELLGKTLGLAGFGRIGQRVAELCHKSLDMPIQYFDVLHYPEAAERLRAKKVALNDLLESSDFVSLHVPFLEETQGLIGEAELRRMKPTAFLINTSRGAVVDQEALITALEEGWIRGAGLDVYDPEPLPSDSSLLTMTNVALSPHMASHTDEALFRMAMVIDDVLAVIRGESPKFQIPKPNQERQESQGG